LIVRNPCFKVALHYINDSVLFTELQKDRIGTNVNIQGRGPNLRRSDCMAIIHSRREFLKPSVLAQCLAAILLVAVGACLSAQREHVQVTWDMQKLSVAPQMYTAGDFHSPGVRSLFFEGLEWKGKPTRVFAWYGVPSHKDGEKLPAMVLVHGGAGTAFANWVRLWNERGYAAIAMDTCGSLPNLDDQSAATFKHDDMGGPPCYEWNQINWPIEDQWQYHAVADVILADSLLRSFPDIDPSRIGLTGISWGGYLTEIIVSVDTRFRFGAPVYGCGFLGENSAWVPEFKKMRPEDAQKWLAMWDPSAYLPHVAIPLLWVDGTNDLAFYMDSLRKSYLLAKGPRTLSMHVRMEHSYAVGEPPEEIRAFADHYLKSGPPLVSIGTVKRRGNKVTVKYKAATPISRAALNYTLDSTQWKDRKWVQAPIEVNAAKDMVRGTLPAGVTAFYIDVIDGNNLVVSSILQD
jgi:cephalosporin-C deacetylase-like acetyl esterase